MLTEPNNKWKINCYDLLMENSQNYGRKLSIMMKLAPRYNFVLILRRMFEFKSQEAKRGWTDSNMMSFKIWILYLIKIKFIKSSRITSIWHVAFRSEWEMLTKFSPSNYEENIQLGGTRRTCRMVRGIDVELRDMLCKCVIGVSFLYSWERDIW